MKLMKKKKGFTLIELMAVIAIIAILAAVLVPTVNGYIMRSRKTAALNQIRTAANAISTYDITNTGTKLTGNVASTETLASVVESKTLSSSATAYTAKLSKAELLFNEDVDLLLNDTLDLTINEVLQLNAAEDCLDRITIARDTTTNKYEVTVVDVTNLPLPSIN